MGDYVQTIVNEDGEILGRDYIYDDGPADFYDDGDYGYEFDDEDYGHEVDASGDYNFPDTDLWD